MTTSIKVTRNIAGILATLSKSFENKDGRISWNMSGLDGRNFGLIASLSFSPTIDDHEKDGAIWRTLNDCATANRFEQEFFIRKLRANVEALRAGPVQSYFVAAQVNVRNYGKLPRSLSSMYCSVAVRRHLSRSVQAKLQSQSGHQRARLHLDSDFLFLVHKGRARHGRGAVEAGYRNLQCCIGILNLSAQGYGISYRSGMPSVPIGSVLLSSAALLIDHKRKTVGDWITDSHYPQTFKHSFIGRVELQELAPYAKRWVRRIKRTDFADRITTAVVLFQEGISATHIDVALIKLWTCIELLCSRPNAKEPLERAIERAAAIFTDTQEVVGRLKFIAESRHAVVHRGEDASHALLCAQWASIYAAEIIGFCAFNIHEFTRHADILDYLGTPKTPERLKEVIKIHATRLKFLTKRSETDPRAVDSENG